MLTEKTKDTVLLPLAVDSNNAAKGEIKIQREFTMESGARLVQISPAPLPTESKKVRGRTFMVVCLREYQRPFQVPHTTPLSYSPLYVPVR